MIGFGMDFLSDVLLGAGALGAAFYCVVLARKLNRLTGLDQELGSAIALLSQQVDEMTGVLETAQKSAAGSRDELQEFTTRAEEVAARLQALTDSSASQQINGEPSHAADSTEGVDSGGLKDGATSLFVRHTARAGS